MTNEKRLIYADDARRAILQEDPKLAYCIERIKAVDAVPVVRCKDCVFSEPNDASDNYVNCRQLFGMAIEKDWYCADGERKNDGK